MKGQGREVEVATLLEVGVILSSPRATSLKALLVVLVTIHPSPRVRQGTIFARLLILQTL